MPEAPGQRPAGTLHLSARHRAMLEALLQEHLPEVEVWAYGSRVNGESHDGSDLDLVLRGPGLAKIDISRLVDFEEALRDSTVPFLVEAHDWARLPESFHSSIERDYVALVEKDRSRRVEWQEKRIEEIAEKVAMGPFGSSIRVNTFVPAGVPIISGQHLHGMMVDDSPGFNFITEEHAERLRSANVERGDVVFTHRGTIGQVAYVPENSNYGRYVISQSQFYMRCDRCQVIPQFVTYYFKTHEGRHKLLANTSQVGVPSIAQPVSYLRSISIPVPHLDVQRAIVRVLEPLDERIKLNRRMNETLDAMARALFMSWFVDFEPVCAKQEDRDTGLPKDIADLFPDRFVASNNGAKVPYGWDVGALANIVEIINGGTPRTSVPEYWDGDIPWYTAKDVPSFNGVFAIDTERTISQLGVANSSTRILPARTTVITARGTVGKIVCLGVPMAMNQTCYGIRGRDGYPELFTYWNLRMSIKELTTRTHGTIFDTITRDTFTVATTIIPPTKVAAMFEDLVSPYMEGILANQNASRNLKAQRDALLPKLVSGELRGE